MTTFTDGPARGQTLTLQRAPYFLRVVCSTCSDGPCGHEPPCKVKWDALDQLTDKPEPDETIYAYEMIGLPMRGFIDGSKYRGPYVIAQYKFVTPQPSEVDMRLNRSNSHQVKRTPKAFGAERTIMAKPKPELPPEIAKSPDFEQVSTFLKSLGEVQLRLAKLQIDINEWHDGLIGLFADRVIGLQSCEQTLTASLQKIAEAHPDWFTSRKSVRTLTGAIEFHASTELVVDDSELTFAALEREEKAALADKRIFFAEDYIRKFQEPNLDALGTLDDETLARLKVKRVPKNNFKAKPAKIDLTKIIAPAETDTEEAA